MKWHDLMFHTLLLLLSASRNCAQETPQNALPYPQFFVQPEKQSVKREMTANVKCGAYGGIGSLSYSFYKGESPQNNMMSMLTTAGADASTKTAVYTISSVSSADAGYYQCIVQDEAGVAIYSDVVYINVVDNYLTPVEVVTESKRLLSTKRLHVLECSMPDSSPDAQPKWFKDDTLIDPDDDNMFASYGSGSIEGISIGIGDLVMFSLTHQHSGIYTCAAFNYLLEEPSNQIDVIHYNITVGSIGEVGEFPSQEAIASDLRVNVGEEAYLFCGGIGNPSPRTSFLTISPNLVGVSDRDSSGGPMAETRLVKVSASLTTTPNSYYATCKVGNSYYTAKLVVMEPPINSVDSVSFVEGQSAPIVYYSDTDSPPRTLPCDTTNDNKVAKQWFKNGLVWNKGSYHETDLSSGFDLIANDIRPEDSGVYQCKAFSGVLAIYRTQVLCVVKKLTIETISPTLTEYEGRSKKLVCTIRGSPTPTITWTIEDRVLESTGGVTITHNSLSYPYTTTLEILNITLLHTGRYKCSAANSVPEFNGSPARDDSVSTSIDLKVQAPVKVTTPRSPVLSYAGNELLLECTTYGEPQPSIPQWSHEDTEISATAGVIEIENAAYAQGFVSTLKIVSISLDNQGNYTCSSWNMVNERAEGSVTISVPVILPVTVTAPVSVELESSVLESITCLATAHPAATQIYWFFNDLPVTENIETSSAGQTLTSILAVTPSGPDSSGTYRCNSSNSYEDSFYEDSVEFPAQYVSPVSIEATSKDLVGVFGNSLALSCRAYGYPLPGEIKWWSEDYTVDVEGLFEVFTTLNEEENYLESQLVVKDVKYSNERDYNCSASNFFKGTDKYAADTIAVLVGAPRIRSTVTVNSLVRQYPVDVRIFSNFAYNADGESVDVTCEVEGKPLPEQVTWTFSGTPGVDLTKFSFYTFDIVGSREHVLNATLTIAEIKGSHVGNYTCTASNMVNGEDYSSSQVVNVALAQPVTVSVTSAEQSVPKGNKATLSCSGEGTPPPNDIAWLFNGDQISEFAPKYITETTNEGIYTVISVLKIADVQLEDKGTYKCQFSNIDKNSETHTDAKNIELIVEVPVEVQFSSLETVELYEGNSTILVCNIFGKPAPESVTWVRSKTGEELVTDDLFEVNTTVLTDNGEKLESTLTIKSMNLDLEGTYECSAQNTLSSMDLVKTPAYRTVLRVEDVSVVPEMEIVPGVVGSTATLTCTATGVPTPGDISWLYTGQDRTIVQSDQYTITQQKFLDETRNLNTKVESTLTINQVKWSDRGAYQCSSSNSVGGAEQSSLVEATLNVEQPVSINSDTAMSRQTLLGNQVGTLSVPLYGYPAPTIKWSSDPPLAPDSSAANYYLVEDYSGVAQLTYQRVSDSMSGNYVMTATNLVHDVSYSISFSLSVDVFYPPAISLEPTWEILEMATAKIPCLVTSRPAASHVTWSVNGSDVTELNKPSKLAVEEMEVDARGEIPLTIRKLVLKEARLGDSGLYTCKAAVFITDSLYYQTKSVNVSVVSAVVVSPSSADVLAIMDEETILTCTASGYPMPSKIIWFVNDTMVSPIPTLIIQETKISYKELHSSLTITRMKPELEGTYRCQSSNNVLGSLKTGKAVIALFRERVEEVGKSVSSSQMLIIGVLAAIIIVVISGVVLLLVCRRRKKQKEKSKYDKIPAPPLSGAADTLASDKNGTGLMVFDPENKDKPYAEVEYVELDPRVYKSDYNRRKGSGKPEPMPRKKHSASYASIDTTHNNNDLEDSRLI